MDHCTMRGALSPTFSDIYIVKMENDVVIPFKPIFYRRFVDDIYSRQKLGGNYHPNIKLTIEINPSKLLGTKLTNINGAYKFNVYQKNIRTYYLHHGPPKLQNAINKIQSIVIFIVQKEYHQTLTKKYL